MTAASNPAAELTEAERREVADAVMAWADGTELEGRVFAAVERILAARLAAGGAATDEGLRARVETLCDAAMKGNTHRGLTGNFISVYDLRAALDAAPAPTEDATCDTCQDAGRLPWMIEGDPHGYQERDSDGTIPCPDCAADTAAEEPRTEAQIKAEALREAADDMDDTDDPDAIYVDNGDIDLWLRARADRLSRAEEAGS